MICDLRTEGDSAICDDCVPHLREGRDVMFAEPEKLTARRTGTSYSWASCKASGPEGSDGGVGFVAATFIRGVPVCCVSVRLKAKRAGDGRRSVARLRREGGCGGVSAEKAAASRRTPKKAGQRSRGLRWRGAGIEERSFVAPSRLRGFGALALRSSG
jgi:hypothetical protein